MSDLVSLTRQFAQSHLVPTFIVDTEGSLVYYNPPAEKILGKSFADTGRMPAAIWSRLFQPSDEDGTPRMPETLPLMIALTERKPAADDIWINGLDNIRRHIQISSFPLINGTGEFLGAVSMFWDT